MASSDTDEGYQRESRAFLTKLFSFHEQHGTPIKRIPLLGGRELNLYHLYKKVLSLGGSEVVTRCRLWGEVARSFNLPPSVTSASYAIRQHYTKLLERYEIIEKDAVLGYAAPPLPSIQPPTLRPLPPHPPPTQLHHPSLTSTTSQRQQQSGETAVKYNRIVRSLLSGFPNEVDFAFNVLTILSYATPKDLPIEKVPHLLDVMLAHVAIFSNEDPGLEVIYYETWHRNSELNFLEFWELVVPEWIFASVLSSSFNKATYHSSLFASRSHLVEEEEEESYRVAQVLTILQNLSFEESSCEYLAGHEGVRKLLLLCLNSYLPSIRGPALDTLSNLASMLLLSHDPFSTTDLILTSVHQCILSEDKHCIIGGLKVLGELAWCLHNEPSLKCTPEGVYQQVFHMLLLADCELVISSLEALYNLSFYGAEIAESIVQVDNSIEILAHLLTTKVEDFNREALERMRLIISNPRQLQLPLFLTNHVPVGSNSANQISAVVNSAPVVVLPGGVHVSNVAVGTDSKMLLPTSQIQPGLLKASNVGSSLLPSGSSLSQKLSQNLSQLLTHSNNSLPPVLTGKQIQDLLGQARGEQKQPSAPSLSTPSPSLLPILTGKQIQDLLLQVRGDPSTPSPSTPSPSTISPSTHTPSTPIPSSSVTKVTMLPSRVQSALPTTRGGTNALGLPKVGMQGDQFAQQWLRMSYEEAPSHYVPRSEMYTLYILCCSELGQTNIINSNDFNNLIRQVFPNALSTRVAVGNHTVYMMAGLRRQKPPGNLVLGENVLLKSQETTSVTNRTAPTVASTAGLTLLAAAAARSGTPSVSIPRLNAPGLSPAVKGNFSAHSPLAIVNKPLGGSDQLKSTLRTLSPVAVTTGQSAPPSHVTNTTLIDHSNSNSTHRTRSLHSHSFSNMTTTTIPPQNGSTPPQNARAGSVPPQNVGAFSTPPQKARAGSMPPQNARTGYTSLQNARAVSTPLLYARSASTPPQTIRPVSAPLSLPILKDASDTQSSVCSLSGRSSPNLSTAQASTRVPSPTSSTSTLSFPSAQPSSVANNPSLQLQESSRPSTPALSISSSCDLESSHSLSGINLQSHPRDGDTVFKDGTSIRTSSPCRSESPVTVSAGEGKQQVEQVEDEDSGESPSVMQLGGGGGARGEVTLQDGETQARSQLPENGSLQEPEPKRLKLDATVAWDSVDLGLQPVNSERTHLGILQSPLKQITAGSVVADEMRTEGTRSPNTPVVTTTRHVSVTATEKTNDCAATGSQTSRTGVSSSDVATSYSTTVSSTASSLVATANGRTNVTTNSTLQESCLASTCKASLTCSSGSWTGTAATVTVTASSAGHGAAVHAPSLMTVGSTYSSCGSDTGTDSNRSMDVEESSMSSETLAHPISTEVGGTRCVCSWDLCNRLCSSWDGLFYHVVYDHLPSVPVFPCACQWQDCPSKVKRMRPSMLRHIQTHHCSAGPKPSPPSVPTTLAKLKALPAYEHESESPLTKAVRLTAGLVLRNLVRTVPEARRQLLRWEHLLCQVALSNSEASTAISQCLYHLHRTPTTTNTTSSDHSS